MEVLLQSQTAAHFRQCSKKPFHHTKGYVCNAFFCARPELNYILTFHNEPPCGFKVLKKTPVWEFFI